MTCEERKDLILLDLAGALDAAEAQDLHAHLENCPQCAEFVAQAEATAAELSLSAGVVTPDPSLKQKLMQRVREESAAPMLPIERAVDSSAPSMPMLKISAGPQRQKGRAPTQWREWERMVLAASIAAVLAVAITLLAVARFTPAPPDRSPEIALLTNMLAAEKNESTLAKEQVEELRKELDGVKLAMMKGPAQPDAVGRAFIDTNNGKWYFFTSGMKPAAQGKTYELWLISDDKKIPAGTFDISNDGNATLLGNIPALRSGAPVTLAVTDEPTGGTTAPTGLPQISGPVE